MGGKQDGEEAYGEAGGEAGVEARTLQRKRGLPGLLRAMCPGLAPLERSCGEH